MTAYDDAIGVMIATLKTGGKGSITPEIVAQTVQGVTDALLAELAVDETSIASKMAKSANLSDLADPPTARNNLGLGSAATKDVGTAAGNVVQFDSVSGKYPAGDGSNLTNVAGTLAADGLTPLQVGAAARSASEGMVNGTIVASVASNALTLAIKTLAGNDPSSTDPVDFFFRSSVTSGGYVRRRVTSALQIQVPSGASIGTPSGQGFAFYVEAIDNGGTVELAAFNPVVGGATPTSIICPVEGQLISTTAIAGATSGGVHYSSAARTNIAFRTLARVSYVSLATAGTWASAPANIDLIKPWSKKPGDIVQARVKSAGTNFSTTTTGSFQATNLSDTISPTSPASLVRVRVTSSLGMTGLQTISSGIFRGSTQLNAGPTNFLNTSATVFNFNTGVAIEALDAPGVAAPVTYTQKINISGGTGSTSGNDMMFLDEVWV